MVREYLAEERAIASEGSSISISILKLRDSYSSLKGCLIRDGRQGLIKNSLKCSRKKSGNSLGYRIEAHFNGKVPTRKYLGRLGMPYAPIAAPRYLPAYF